MLIDFRQLFPKYGIKPNGVLHIGANVGEEFPVYMELGIVKQMWFEPNPDIFAKLVQNIASNNEALAYKLCVGDRFKPVILHESNNAGQSSSILNLGTHKEAHPDVHYVRDIPAQMVRLDEYFGKDGLSKDYDFLNIDIQGAELLALIGMGELLHQFKWAYLEVNKAHLYEGCALVEEIDEYLAKFGFERVETSWAGNTNWGDALYVKKEAGAVVLPAKTTGAAVETRTDVFEQELSSLINRHSLENESDTPDFILAKYMKECLDNFNKAIHLREIFYGRKQGTVN